MRIGIDAGGTFTDFVVAMNDGCVETFKIRSNPANPAAVILEGLTRVAPGKRDEVIHGSTVATNALLERKGARTALVTTAGFEDVIQIGRQNREHLYVLSPPPKKGLADPELCFGVKERTYFDGTVARRAGKAGSIEAPVDCRRMSRRSRSAFFIRMPILRMRRPVRAAIAGAAPTSAARTRSARSFANTSVRQRLPQCVCRAADGSVSFTAGVCAKPVDHAV